SKPQRQTPGTSSSTSRATARGSVTAPAVPRRAPREVVRDLVERRPADPVVAVDVLDDPLEHQDHLRPPAHVGVDRHPEDGVVLLAIDVVELVAPDLLEVPRVDEAVAVRGAL